MNIVAHGSFLCFRSVIPPGFANRFTLSQPVDLALDIRSTKLRLRIDSFDFGTETATLAEKGEYKIRIVALDQPVPRNLIVSRKRISLQEGTRFRLAENLGTETKQNWTESGIQDSLNLWKELREDSAVARTQLKLGDYRHKQQRYAEARRAYEAAADLCGSLDDLRCRTEALNNIGLESQQLADFNSARSNLEEASRGWDLLGNRDLAGRTLANLGLLYRIVHEYRQALSFDERAAAILERSDRTAFAKVLIDFGLCYQALAEFGRAKGYFERALRIANSIKGDESISIRAQIDLGRTYLSIGRPLTAALWLSRANAAAEKLADRAALADSSNNLAQAFLVQGLVPRAKPLLESALRLHRVLGDQRFAAADQHYLGVVAAREGRADDAKLRFTEATSMRIQSNLRLDAADSLFELAQLEFGAGHRDVARDLATQSLNLTEAVRLEISSPALRGSFSSARRKTVHLLIDIAISRGGPEHPGASFLIAEQGQGRAMLDLLAESALLTPPSHEIQEKKALLERQIVLISQGMLNLPSDRLHALRSQVQMLAAERENIDAEIRTSQPERRFGRPLDSVERLQRRILPPETALLEFHVGEPESHLWFVTSEALELFQLAPQKKIERHIAEFVSLFTRVADRKRLPELQKRFDQATRSLSRELLEALRGKTLPDTLVLVCDGGLNRLPFEALTIPGKPKPIGLTHNLVRVPSAGYLEAGREVRRSSEFAKTFLGVVDPVFSVTDPRLGKAAAQYSNGAELPRLPFTFELDRVNRLVEPSRRVALRGFQANKRRLEGIDLEHYAILHFSTHAIIDDTEPELSRVALSLVDQSGRPADGYLHPSHFSEWHLSGSSVVLSACETALGKQLLGEGFWGLTAALFKAGASQLVLTLSPVDSEGSSEFFSHVYENLLSRKSRGMEQALTKARQALAASQRWSDPYYWASYVLLGRPTTAYHQGTS